MKMLTISILNAALMYVTCSHITQTPESNQAHPAQDGLLLCLPSIINLRLARLGLIIVLILLAFFPLPILP